jgi:molybdate transport system substrate-binding protein
MTKNLGMTNTLARAALLAVLFVAIAPAQETEIHIVCSNGFKAGMEKLLHDGERNSGRTAKLKYGASANLKKSIEGGEPFDLAILTPQIVEDLIKDGKIAAGTKVDLASSGVGLAVRAGRSKPDVATAAAMKQTLLAAKSIGYVGVGAGTPAILDMLDRLGIRDAVQNKTVLQQGASESMKNLADGKLDVDFALISEILPAAGVQLVGPLPSEFQRKIVLSAGIGSAATNREAASKFIKALTSPAAATAVKSVGLEPIR